MTLTYSRSALLAFIPVKNGVTKARRDLRTKINKCDVRVGRMIIRKILCIMRKDYYNEEVIDVKT